MDQNKERKMKKAKQFGETVEGYNIPVLNEREIRASAGILYFFMFLAWMLVIFNENYFLIKIVNTVFLTDFIIRVLISPKYSPTLVIGRLIVGNQNPEYVGAAQKKFAWTIGVSHDHIPAVGCNEFNQLHNRDHLSNLPDILIL
jgi:hypothetical protein